MYFFVGNTPKGKATINFPSWIQKSQIISYSRDMLFDPWNVRFKDPDERDAFPYYVRWRKSSGQEAVTEISNLSATEFGGDADFPAPYHTYTENSVYPGAWPMLLENCTERLP